MVSCTQTQLCPKCIIQPFQELTCEYQISMAHDITRNFVKPNDLLKYNLAKLKVVIVVFIGKNYALLVNRSTITQTHSLSFLDLDSPSIKSIVICSHFHFLNLKWLKQSSCFLMVAFDLLAVRTPTRKKRPSSYLPTRKSIYILIHLCNSRMYRKSQMMTLCQIHLA